MSKDNIANAYIAEYQSLREEILLQIGHQNSTINYSILVVGVALTLVTGNIDAVQGHPIILLLFSIFLSGLILYYFQLAILLAILSNYIKYKLTPGMSKLGVKGVPVLWESHNQTFSNLSVPTVLTISKLIIPYIANISFTVFFWLQTEKNNVTLQLLDWAVLVSALILLVFTFVLPFLTLKYRRWKKI
jgi:hypothetical protein